MEYDVTWEVLSSGLSSKTALLFHCSHVANKHALDRKIIKLLTSFFEHYNIGVIAQHRQVSNVMLLASPKLVWRHFTTNGCHYYCFQCHTFSNIYCSFHFGIQNDFGQFAHFIMVFASLTTILFDVLATPSFCGAYGAVRFNSMPSIPSSCMRSLDVSS